MQGKMLFEILTILMLFQNLSREIYVGWILKNPLTSPRISSQAKVVLTISKKKRIVLRSKKRNQLKGGVCLPYVFGDRLCAACFVGTCFGESYLGCFLSVNLEMIQIIQIKKKLLLVNTLAFPFFNTYFQSPKKRSSSIQTLKKEKNVTLNLAVSTLAVLFYESFFQTPRQSIVL